MQQSTSSLIGDRQPIATPFRSGSQFLSGRTLLLPIAVMFAFGACAGNKNLVGKSVGPMGEAELAAKKLQLPLDTHLCKAVVYPTARPDWKISRVVSLQGRGANFQAALSPCAARRMGSGFPPLSISTTNVPSPHGPSTTRFEVQPYVTAMGLNRHQHRS